jgi:hypothetical protein
MDAKRIGGYGISWFLKLVLAELGIILASDEWWKQKIQVHSLSS